MKRYLLCAAVSLFAVLGAASCVSTRIVWIPVYTITSGGENDRTSYDPAKSALINPSDNSTYAYFKTDKGDGIVFANRDTLSFGEKVIYQLQNGAMTLNEEGSTKQKISYLDLRKSFCYDLAADSTVLFDQRDDAAVYNNERLHDGEIVKYDILGQSLGTAPVSRVTVVDVLPAGFIYSGSEYSFSAQNGVFKHKLVSDNGKNALVLDADLRQPLGPGDKFIVRVSVKLDKSKMEKLF
jgi:uncharacterized repeat protein (TIGR01451 family)